MVLPVPLATVFQNVFVRFHVPPGKLLPVPAVVPFRSQYRSAAGDMRGPIVHAASATAINRWRFLANFPFMTSPCSIANALLARISYQRLCVGEHVDPPRPTIGRLP